MRTPQENIQPSDLQVACTWRLHGDHQAIWYHKFILNPTSELFPELILMSLISALTSVRRAWASHWQVQIHKDKPKGIHPTADLNQMPSSTHSPNPCLLILIQCPARKAALVVFKSPVRSGFLAPKQRNRTRTGPRNFPRPGNWQPDQKKPVLNGPYISCNRSFERPVLSSVACEDLA